jgi:sensor histidine kinase YesM
VTAPIIRALAQSLYDNRDYRFWLCQLTGWCGYSLATFFSITLLDNNVSWAHVGHITLQAALGVLTTWPLRSIYRASFSLPLAKRTLIGIVSVVVFSSIWTYLRILTFAWMSGEDDLWGEYNYWYFGSVFVFLSWTVLYYGINYYELFLEEHQKLLVETARRENERFRRLQAESSAREAQLRMLRYQLNPHFLFNTLNAITALVRVRDNARAVAMIQRLSRFLRHSLSEESVEAVPLEQELESLQLYLDIESARFEDRLRLEFDVDLQAREALVPSLILQPVVENSMKYAIDPSEEGGTVRIVARRDGAELQLVVSDTGPGIDAALGESCRGVGLRNTLNRLATLYDSHYSFSTRNLEPSGLAVEIRIPFRSRPAAATAAAAVAPVAPLSRVEG